MPFLPQARRDELGDAAIVFDDQDPHDAIVVRATDGRQGGEARRRRRSLRRDAGARGGGARGAGARADDRYAVAARARRDRAPLRPARRPPRSSSERRRRLDHLAPHVAETLAAARLLRRRRRRQGVFETASPPAHQTLPPGRRARRLPDPGRLRRPRGRGQAGARRASRRAPACRCWRRPIPATRAAISGVVGLGLPDVNELGWHWRDALIYVTHGSPDEPSFSTASLAARVAPVPLAAIHSTPRRVRAAGRGAAGDRRGVGAEAAVDRAPPPTIASATTWPSSTPGSPTPWRGSRSRRMGAETVPLAGHGSGVAARLARVLARGGRLAAVRGGARRPAGRAARRALARPGQATSARYRVPRLLAALALTVAQLRRAHRLRPARVRVCRRGAPAPADRRRRAASPTPSRTASASPRCRAPRCAIGSMRAGA